MFKKKYELSAWECFWLGAFAMVISSVSAICIIPVEICEERDKFIDKIKSVFKRD